MAQSRFDARNRNWDEDADMQRYGGDRSRGNREDDPRMRGGPEDRNRDRFDARYQDRGQDEARGAERDRSSGGGMDAASGYGFGAAGFDPRDRDDRRGGSDRSDRDYGSERRSQDERSWGYGPQIGREWDRRGQSYDERHGRGGPRFYDSAGERGFMDRAADEVMSWMGDDEAGRRREEDHRGKGPRGYQRSDTRIHDDVNDRLSDDPRSTPPTSTSRWRAAKSRSTVTFRRSLTSAVQKIARIRSRACAMCRTTCASARAARAAQERPRSAEARPVSRAAGSRAPAAPTPVSATRAASAARRPDPLGSGRGGMARPGADRE